MLSSIGKFSKSFFVKLLVGIIILPFVFWGMGDVFRGGNQNVIASIGSEKISTQEFINYLNKLNLNENERKNLNKSNLLEQILSEYIGRKIINLEINDLGIEISDNSLKNILLNDKTFFKGNKFSRTKYEKFLIESSLSAPVFESNIVEQEKKRQLLSFLSKGIVIPDYIIENEYKKENQIKEVRYLDLNKYYEKQSIKDEDIKKIYDENKAIFVEQFKSISFLELNPELLVGTNDYNEAYFNKIDEIENQILDGKNISMIAKERNLKSIVTKEINFEKKDFSGNKINNISDELFKKIFNKQQINEPELINLNNKYYLAEVSSVIKKNRDINDKLVIEAITSNLKTQYKLEMNTKITKEISKKEYNLNSMIDFATKNNVKIEDTTIKNLGDNKIFTTGLIKRIYEMQDDDIILITDSNFSKNFVVFSKKTKLQSLNKDSKDYEKYLAKAKLSIASKIYTTYDIGVNKKYNVELNNKAIERIKNSF